MSPSLSELASLRLNWRAYLQLVRWPLILGLAASYLYYAYVLPATLVEWRMAPPDKTILETVGHGLFRLPSNWSGARVFATFAMATPVLLGFALATIIRPALQWRFTLVLPRLRIALLACHASALAFAALVCASLARFWDATSFFATFGCAFAALSLTLPPSDPRSNRTKVGTFAKILASLVVLGFAPELRDLAQQSPLLVGIGGLVIASLCFHAALPIATLREAEETPLVLSQQGLFGTTEAMLRAAQLQRWRTTSFEGRPWRHGRLRDSARFWLRVFNHERHGATPVRRLVLSALFVAAAIIVVPASVIRAHVQEPVSMGELGVMLYSIVCDADNVGHGVAQVLGMTATLGFLVLILMTPLPRFDYLYVVSRVRRAQLVHLAFLRHTGLMLLTFVAVGLLAAAVGAGIGGIPFQLNEPPLFLRAMLGALPFVPLWQCYAVAELTQSPLATKALATAGLIATTILAIVCVASDAFAAILPWLLFGVVLGQWIFRRFLRALFLKADLTKRS